MDERLEQDIGISTTVPVMYVDFSWVLYKSYYAFDSLSTVIDNQIVKTGTIYGFVSFLKTIRRRIPNIELVFCLDSPINIKMQQHSFYKGNRTKKPGAHVLTDEIINLLSGFPYCKVFSAQGYESDDLIWTFAKKDDGRIKYVYSGDDDLLQLTQYPWVKIVRMLAVDKFNIIDADYTFKKFGVKPEYLLMYRSIVGDTSDNIPACIKRFPRHLARHVAEKYKTPYDFVKEEKLDHPKLKDLKASEVMDQFTTNFQLLSLVELADREIIEVKVLFKGFPYFISRYALSSLRELMP